MGCVDRWLGRVAPRTRVSYFSVLNRFCRAVSVSPDELVAKQKAADGDDRFALLDRLQDYVNALDVTRNYKVFTYNAVRSFFLHNRAELPRERFNIQNSKPPSTPHLTVEHVRRIVYAATVRDRSMILCAFAGFMGKGELEHVNLQCWPQIRDQWSSSLIRIDLPGRKTNHRPYYTFIGGDALQALREYIGDDLKRKAIWTTKYNVPISRKAFYKAFFRLSQRVGYVSRKRGDLGVRYGFNPHEMRDLARSLWHQSGADRDVAEFCCPPWSYIFAEEDGPKPISEVTFNDRVLADDGLFHQVIGTFRRNYSGKLIRLQPRAFGVPLDVTPDHPILAIRLRDCPVHGRSFISNHRYLRCECMNPGEYKPEFIPAKDLVLGDLIAHPMINGSSDTPQFSDSQLRLFGYYVAEGSCHNGKSVTFSFGSDEDSYIDEVTHTLRDYYGEAKHESIKPSVLPSKRKVSSKNIHLYNRAWSRWFRQSFGGKATRKRIPSWIMRLPRERIKFFIQGLWNGDGCVYTEDGHMKFSLSTASKGLALQVTDLLLKASIRPDIRMIKTKTPKGNPAVRWHVRVNNWESCVKMGELLNIDAQPYKPGRTRRTCLEFENFILLPIMRKEEIDYSGPVYNMTVEDRNTFICEGIATHNCMGHNVDPLRYDKIYTLDPKWVQSEYLKALPYLNLLSTERDVKKQQDTIKLLEERIAEMEKTLAEIKNS